MLRLTEYIRDSVQDRAIVQTSAVICIWNLTSVCNLSCRHCYASAGSVATHETRLSDVESALPEMRAAGVRVAILSGGEPLLRPDILDIARAVRAAGISTALSTNGLLIDRANIGTIQQCFDYIGISIDGSPDIHDSFRGMAGAYEKSLGAIRTCMEHGVEVGLRFTLSALTHESLPFIFDLVRAEGIPKLYISHLVTSGRAETVPSLDAATYARAERFIIEKAFEFYENNVPVKIVTGNNDSEAVMLLSLFKERYPLRYDNLYERLRAWGGNQAGVKLVNITSAGEVKPDPFFQYSMGNIGQGESFSRIWSSNGLLSALRERPRALKGRCKACHYLDICNGNSRARAYAATGDYFSEDPLCTTC
ncbi:MAG: radical SAM protein [Nitrospirae bacterium]|nr:radical SAM protein [Nitrospirota bacterium]